MKQPPNAPAGEHISQDGPPTNEGRAASIEEKKALVQAPMLQVISPELYEKKSELGKGGLGQVSRVVDKRLMREVALKQLLPNKEKVQERFLREALITSRLQHPSIVSVYEVGFWPSGEPFYTMKMIVGSPLKEAIERAGSLGERLGLLPNLLAACEAIAYAHSRRVLHRDLKPQNILIGEFGETVVIDWGVAKDLTVQSTSTEQLLSTQEMLAAINDTGPMPLFEANSSSSNLTMTGAILGTPAYMPPEQAKGSPVDERADVYSLGAILYQLLAGVPPYTGPYDKIILRQVLQGAPAALSSRQQGVPKDLVSITQKAMARDKYERYPSAKELAEDLKKFLTGQLVGAYQYSRGELFWRWFARYRALIVVAGLLSVALIASVSLSFQKITQERNSAQQSQQEAEKQRALTSTLNEKLFLNQARLSLEKSPILALSWLKFLPHTQELLGVARTIAADALNRGIPQMIPLDSPANLLAFSKDRRWLAATTEVGEILLWSTSCQEPPCAPAKKLAAISGDLSNLLFSPDSGWLVVSGSDPNISLLSIETGEIKTLSGHTKAITSVVFSSDSAQLFSTSNDNTIRAWELTSGQARSMNSEQNLIGKISLSPDNTKLASISWDNTARLFDANTGELLASQQITGGGDIQFSPSGDKLAIASDDGNVYLWDTALNTIQTLRGHENVVTRVRFSPDGKLLASASWDHTVRVWSLSEAEPTSRVLFGHEQNVQHIEFSSDGVYLASAGQDETIRLWDVSQSPIVPDRNRALRGPELSVSNIAFSADGALLASANGDPFIRLWRARPQEQQALRGHTENVRALAYSPDGKTFATGADDKSIQIWSTADTSRPVEILTGHPDAVVALSFSSNAKLFSIGDTGASILWDLSSKTHEQLTPGEPDRLKRPDVPINDLLSSDLARFVETNLASSPTKKLFASRQKEAQLFDESTHKLSSLDPHKTPISQLALSPDGRLLASASYDGEIFLYTLGAQGHKTLSAHKDAVYALAFSPDGGTLASAGYDGVIRLWNTQTGEHKELARHKSAVLHLAFSYDGRSLASGSFDQTAILWDLNKGTSTVLEGHKRRVFRVAFSPDASTLATASFDGTIRLWDLASQESRVLRGHSDEIYALAFSPDGKSLLSGGRDDMAYLWADDLPKETKTFFSWLQNTTTPFVDPNK